MADTIADQLADREAIRELLVRYCFHRDNDQFEAMGALFLPEGVWETAFGTGTGLAGIVAQACSIASGGRPRPAHLTSDIVVVLAGAAATARSNWMLAENTPSGLGNWFGRHLRGPVGEAGWALAVPASQDRPFHRRRAKLRPLRRTSQARPIGLVGLTNQGLSLGSF